MTVAPLVPAPLGGTILGGARVTMFSLSARGMAAAGAGMYALPALPASRLSIMPSIMPISSGESAVPNQAARFEERAKSCASLQALAWLLSQSLAPAARACGSWVCRASVRKSATMHTTLGVGAGRRPFWATASDGIMKGSRAARQITKGVLRRRGRDGSMLLYRHGQHKHECLVLQQALAACQVTGL